MGRVLTVQYSSGEDRYGGGGGSGGGGGYGGDSHERRWSPPRHRRSGSVQLTGLLDMLIGLCGSEVSYLCPRSCISRYSTGS